MLMVDDTNFCLSILIEMTQAIKGWTHYSDYSFINSIYIQRERRMEAWGRIKDVDISIFTETDGTTFNYCLTHLLI